MILKKIVTVDTHLALLDITEVVQVLQMQKIARLGLHLALPHRLKRPKDLPPPLGATKALLIEVGHPLLLAVKMVHSRLLTVHLHLQHKMEVLLVPQLKIEVGHLHQPGASEVDQSVQLGAMQVGQGHSLLLKVKGADQVLQQEVEEPGVDLLQEAQSEVKLEVLLEAGPRVQQVKGHVQGQDLVVVIEVSLEALLGADLAVQQVRGQGQVVLKAKAQGRGQAALKVRGVSQGHSLVLQ